MLFSAGCSGDRGNWFQGPKSSEDYLEMALESKNADDRRRGVVGLSETRDGTSDWAIKVFDTIARHDIDAMVRCAAIKALSKSINSARVPTALELVQADETSSQVRWAAARLLHSLVEAEACSPDDAPLIVNTSVKRLSMERDNHVRTALIETLGFFESRRVVIALIDVMEDEDFAIQHAAEMSLVSLTGTTHDHDPEAWREWLAATSDPFANAGQIPAGMQVDRSKKRWDWLEWWE